MYENALKYTSINLIIFFMDLSPAMQSLSRQSEQVDARLYVRTAEENKIEREFESRS